MKKHKIAIIGCGFVADFYAETLKNYPEISVLGVFDTDTERQHRFANFYDYFEFKCLEDLLKSDADIVVNLTNPRAHYKISMEALEAGKHVYSEKPLAMDLSEATLLVNHAESKGLKIISAPCNVLSDSAQTLSRSLEQKLIGDPYLVYAELDDGLVHKMRYKHWISQSGSPWPYKDEFEVGCTLEHAAYYVTWLIALFGPAKKVTSFASCQIKDKKSDTSLNMISPDFSVGCIEFESGMVARLTCSIIAPHDHSFTVFGEEGILRVNECWKYTSPVYLKKLNKYSLWAEKYPLLTKVLGLGPKKLPFATKWPIANKYKGVTEMDFARGIKALGNLIEGKSDSIITPRFCLHVNEIVLALQNSSEVEQPYQLQSEFVPRKPTNVDDEAVI